MAEKSKILIIGGTGLIGSEIVKASVNSGHPTFALVRENSLSGGLVALARERRLSDLQESAGVTILSGDLYDHESLVKAVKQVDVVISAVGLRQLGDQEKIIAAIKEAGNVKRFFPSEFGTDVDRSGAVEPLKSFYEAKAKIRRSIEAAAIPYTYVSANYFAGYSLPTLAQPCVFAPLPPRDEVVIYGDGHVKGVFNEEKDIATYTMKAVEDPRTLNKVLYIKPPNNIHSQLELVGLWEKKIGRTLDKYSMPEEKMLECIQKETEKSSSSSSFYTTLNLAMNHSIFYKGDHTSFAIDPSLGVEASELYPDVNYVTVDDYLDKFIF